MGWKKEKLGEVCELIARGIAPNYTEDGGTRVINQKCIRDHKIDFSLARRNDHASKKVPANRLIRVGDVLVNSTGTGTLGRVAQVRCQPDEPTTVDTHVSIVRPKFGKFSSAFFGYMLINIEDDLIAGGLGASGQTELPRTDLDTKFEVSYPTSLEEQQRIVTVLDEAFEGLARARTHVEANLQNARELFAVTIEASLQRAGGVPLTLAEMLERKWIKSHLDGNHGSSYPRKDEFVSEGVPYISANCIDGDVIDLRRCKFLTSERADTLRKGVAQNRDVIFAHNATVGPVALLTTDQPRIILSTSLTYYRCDEEKIIPEFLVFEMRSSGFKRQYEAVMAQATRNQVPITMQRTFIHNIPSIDKQLKIAEICVRIESDARDLEYNYRQKLQDIDDLRKSILQKAFAGELT